MAAAHCLCTAPDAGPTRMIPAGRGGWFLGVALDDADSLPRSVWRSAGNGGGEDSERDSDSWKPAGGATSGDAGPGRARDAGTGARGSGVRALRKRWRSGSRRPRAAAAHRPGGCAGTARGRTREAGEEGEGRMCGGRVCGGNLWANDGRCGRSVKCVCVWARGADQPSRALAGACVRAAMRAIARATHTWVTCGATRWGEASAGGAKRARAVCSRAGGALPCA